MLYPSLRRQPNRPAGIRVPRLNSASECRCRGKGQVREDNGNRSWVTRSAQLIQAYIDRRRQASFIVCQDITSAPHRSLDCLVGGHHKDPIYGGTAFQCRDRIEGRRPVPVASARCPTRSGVDSCPSSRI